MNAGAKVRILLACFGLVALFIGFGIRLYYLQVVKHHYYSQIAAEQHDYKEIIYAQRGLIMDANHEVLANNEPVNTVVADGSLMTNRDSLTAILSKTLHMDSAALSKRLDTTRRYVVLKKEVPVSVTRQIKAELHAQHLRGIFFEPAFTRTYPNGEMLCHVLGFVNSANQGVAGVERSLNKYLHGHDGFRYIEHDRKGRELVPYRGDSVPARDGNNVQLTIDMNLQNIVETALDAAVKKYHPECATVIMVRPQTGEILALASRPGYDPNDVSKTMSEKDAHRRMKDVAIQDVFEPGSTFKIVTTSAALNEKVITPDTIIHCGGGSFYYKGNTLHDDHPNGDLTVSGILIKSSNIGAAHLGLKLGEQRLYEYIRRFGFGDISGVMLPGEIRGLVYPPYRWSKISITHIPMGQEVAVTPMQTVYAMSTIANGGHLMLPQIVHQVTNAKGEVVANYPPVQVRQVVRPDVANKIHNYLKGVVSKKGTARYAAVPGFQVAGKTGTAQKIDPVHGGYMHNKYVVSFVGFMPADHPAFCMIVLLDAPKTKPGMCFGGLVAAPIFSEIAQKAASYLNLTPTLPLPPEKVANARH